MCILYCSSYWIQFVYLCQIYCRLFSNAYKLEWNARRAKYEKYLILLFQRLHNLFIFASSLLLYQNIVINYNIVVVFDCSTFIYITTIIVSEYYPITFSRRKKKEIAENNVILHLQSYTWESPTFSRRGGISEERGCNSGCERWWWRGRTVKTWCRCRWKRGTFHGRFCPSSTASSSTSSSTTDTSSSTSTLARGTTLWCTGSATPTGPPTFPATTTATGTPAATRHHYSL